MSKGFLDLYKKTPKKSFPNLTETDFLSFLQDNDYTETIHNINSFSERINLIFDLLQKKGEKEKLLILGNFFIYSFTHGSEELKKEIENRSSDLDLRYFSQTELAHIITGLILNGEIDDTSILTHILDKVKNLSRREQIVAVLFSLLVIIKRELIKTGED